MKQKFFQNLTTSQTGNEANWFKISQPVMNGNEAKITGSRFQNFTANEAF
jgi:hypothetical protein